MTKRQSFQVDRYFASGGDLVLVRFMRAMLVVMATSLFSTCASMFARDRQYFVDNDPPVLDLIKTADEVYVFPVANTLKPHRDDKHLRPLEVEAKRKIVRLLGNPKNWWQGGWSLVLPDDGSTDIGLLFRRGRNELVLFFNGDLVLGTFNGQETKGLFGADERRKKKLEEWKHRYAHPEFSGQKRPNQAMQPTAGSCEASLFDD